MATLKTHYPTLQGSSLKAPSPESCRYIPAIYMTVELYASYFIHLLINVHCFGNVDGKYNHMTRQNRDMTKQKPRYC